MRNLLFLTLVTLLFTGCLTKELPAYSVYTLQLDKVTVSNSKNNKSIYVAQPKALDSLKSKKILYVKGLEQGTYALSIWSDEPAKMLQQLLTNRLAQDTGYNYVTTSKLKQATDLTLYSELISFEHQLNNPSKALLHLRIYLKDNHTEKITTKEFRYEQIIQKDNAHNAVVALNELSKLLANDVNGFVLKSIKE